VLLSSLLHGPPRMVSLRRPFLVLGQTCFWVLSIIGVELPLHVPGAAPLPLEEFACRPSDVFGALPPQAPRDRLWCREQVQEALHQALHVRFLPSPGHRASERRGEGSRRALDDRVESYYPGGVPVPPPPEGHVAQYLRDCRTPEPTRASSAPSRVGALGVPAVRACSRSRIRTSRKIIKPRSRVSIDISCRREVGVPLIPFKGIAYPNTNFQILTNTIKFLKNPRNSTKHRKQPKWCGCSLAWSRTLAFQH